MQEPETRDRVTISFYGTELDNDKSLVAAIKQIPNIKNIKQKLSAAARKANRRPPEIVLSILIIPDWEHGSSYEKTEYQKAKQNYFNKFKNFLVEEQELKDVIVEDFYAKDNLSEGERAYLQHLEAKGSNADMIKTHAIIENAGRRHLQIDSNTKIFDFEELYEETFGKKDQKDALNASYYDRDNQYVSAHNKVIYTTYTTPGGKIALALKNVHLDYCKQHKDDHTSILTKEEKVSKNSIYSRDFVVALETIGLTLKKTIYHDNNSENNAKNVYLAVMKEPEYRLTRCIATTVNMSWKGDKEEGEKPKNEELEKLKRLPPVTIGEAECDYLCFANTAAKHVDILNNHKPDIKDGEILGDDDDALYDDDEAHNQLMAISNQPLERAMIKSFIENVARTNNEMLEPVIATMRPKTRRGGDLFIELFQCNVEQFFEQVKRDRMEKEGRPPYRP